MSSSATQTPHIDRCGIEEKCTASVCSGCCVPTRKLREWERQLTTQALEQIQYLAIGDNRLDVRVRYPRVLDTTGTWTTLSLLFGQVLVNTSNPHIEFSIGKIDHRIAVAIQPNCNLAFVGRKLRLRELGVKHQGFEQRNAGSRRVFTPMNTAPLPYPLHDTLERPHNHQIPNFHINPRLPRGIKSKNNRFISP